MPHYTESAPSISRPSEVRMVAQRRFVPPSAGARSRSPCSNVDRYPSIRTQLVQLASSVIGYDPIGYPPLGTAPRQAHGKWQLGPWPIRISITRSIGGPRGRNASDSGVDQKPRYDRDHGEAADDYDKLADEAETRGKGTLVLGPLRSA
jgi:hypothetical protein